MRTPRRLVLRAEGLPERQADSEELVTGPRESGAGGGGRGLRKKQGIDAGRPGSCSRRRRANTTLSRRRSQAARPRDILAEALPGLILKITFPKTMYWTGKGGPRFIRPIRWIVALLGDESCPFEIAGVQSGNLTGGPPHAGRGAIPVTIDDLRSRSCARTS